MFYRIRWTTTTETDCSSREYIASTPKDAWELWNHLTTRAIMEPEYHEKMVKERRESALFSPLYIPPRITVNVYEINDTEVDPSQGLNGMFLAKEGDHT
jgi:hypothetical protein